MMNVAPTIPMSIDPMLPQLATALRQFVPISLADMDNVSLMRRIDTKYIIHQDQLPAILESVKDQYAILEINQMRAMRYVSQYFDTAACQFFNDHHSGKARRAKVRIRSYVDSGISFLEIKQKSVKGVTNKRRIRFKPTDMELSPEAQEFIGDALAGLCDLQPTIQNRFRRLTLVDTHRGERVTIDWDLSSRFDRIDHKHPNLVVIEVKQEGLDRHAPIMRVLKSVGARPYRVSKYCLGMTCLFPDLKSNQFKSKLLHIDRVTTATRH